MSEDQKQYSAFISYASADRDRANEICESLERRGLTCWIAPRDVRAGREYGEEIIHGIEQARCLVVILSSAANESAFVRREVERAVSKKKPVFSIRVEDVVPSRSLELFVSTAHWIDAFKSGQEKPLENLYQSVTDHELLQEESRRSERVFRWNVLKNRVAPVAGMVVAVVLGLAIWNAFFDSHDPEIPDFETTPLHEISEEDVVVQSVTSMRSGVSIAIRFGSTVFFDPSYRLQYSFDGRNFTDSYNLTSILIRDAGEIESDELYLRLASQEETSQILGPFEVDLVDKMVSSIAENLQQGPGRPSNQTLAQPDRSGDGVKLTDAAIANMPLIKRIEVAEDREFSSPREYAIPQDVSTDDLTSREWLIRNEVIPNLFAPPERGTALYIRAEFINGDVMDPVVIDYSREIARRASGIWSEVSDSYDDKKLAEAWAALENTEYEEKVKARYDKLTYYDPVSQKDLDYKPVSIHFVPESERLLLVRQSESLQDELTNYRRRAGMSMGGVTPPPWRIEGIGCIEILDSRDHSKLVEVDPYGLCDESSEAPFTPVELAFAFSENGKRLAMLFRGKLAEVNLEDGEVIRKVQVGFYTRYPYFIDGDIYLVESREDVGVTSVSLDKVTPNKRDYEYFDYNPGHRGRETVRFYHQMDLLWPRTRELDEWWSCFVVEGKEVFIFSGKPENMRVQKIVSGEGIKDIGEVNWHAWPDSLQSVPWGCGWRDEGALILAPGQVGTALNPSRLLGAFVNEYDELRVIDLSDGKVEARQPISTRRYSEDFVWDLESKRISPIWFDEETWIWNSGQDELEEFVYEYADRSSAVYHIVALASSNNVSYALTLMRGSRRGAAMQGPAIVWNYSDQRASGILHPDNLKTGRGRIEVAGMDANGSRIATYSGGYLTIWCKSDYKHRTDDCEAE